MPNDQLLAQLFVRLQDSKQQVESYTQKLTASLTAFQNEVVAHCQGLEAVIGSSATIMVGFGLIEGEPQVYASYLVHGEPAQTPILKAPLPIQMYAYQNRDKLLQALVTEAELMVKKYAEEFPPDTPNEAEKPVEEPTQA